jgi:uncharacterized protein (DUF1800 family)
MWRAWVVALVSTSVCACATNPGLKIPSIARRPDDRLLTHVINRTSFGPRPGDVARVRDMGLGVYLERQLHPDSIPDEPIEAQLAALAGLRVTPSAFSRDFYLPMVASRQNFTDTQKGTAKLPYLGWHLLPIAAATLPDPAKTSGIIQQNTVTQPELLYQRRNQQVFDDVQAQKLFRAVNGQRQLQEVLTDFWFNHFNVDARKIEDKPVIVEYERDVIRPRVLGRFRDLLGAIAKSPAMLFYLDNWMSRANALNENYGRELLELHTLGVDGGYTQNDVVNVARAFTGWTMAKPHEATGFEFNVKIHDRKAKRILGKTLPAGRGIEDGEDVLDMVARHPSTARFIATKLVRRFVSDDPPKALVDRAAKTFMKTDGDLREVMRTILTSPEFYAPAAQAAKAKSPFEFVASALRATDATITNPRSVSGTIAAMGEPLYQCQPPTGYGDRAGDWINTGALVTRMNFVVSLAANGANAAKFDLPKTDADRNALALRLGGPEFQRR